MILFDAAYWQLLVSLTAVAQQSYTSGAIQSYSGQLLFAQSADSNSTGTQPPATGEWQPLDFTADTGEWQPLDFTVDTGEWQPLDFTVDTGDTPSIPAPQATMEVAPVTVYEAPLAIDDTGFDSGMATAVPPDVMTDSGSLVMISSDVVVHTPLDTFAMAEMATFDTPEVIVAPVDLLPSDAGATLISPFGVIEYDVSAGMMPYYYGG
jgi:hypothetical protein